MGHSHTHLWASRCRTRWGDPAPPDGESKHAYLPQVPWDRLSAAWGEAVSTAVRHTTDTGSPGAPPTPAQGPRARGPEGQVLTPLRGLQPWPRRTPMQGCLQEGAGLRTADPPAEGPVTGLSARSLSSPMARPRGSDRSWRPPCERGQGGAWCPQRPSLHGRSPVGPETNLTRGRGRLHRAGHRREGLTVQVQQAGLLREGPRGLELGSTGRGGRQLVTGRGRGTHHSGQGRPRQTPQRAPPTGLAPAPSPHVCPHLAGGRGPRLGGS